MVRTWVRALNAALATAAVLGAGQLGVAYGLGVLRWNQAFNAGNENGWSAHLTWTAWIASLAVVGGAVGGVRTLRRNDVAAGFGGWLAVSLAALVGAAVVVPLVALPAREAQVASPLDPALQAGITAGVGLVIGLFGALAVLCGRPVAAAVLVTAVWVWALALVSAASQLGQRTPAAGQRLGVLRLPALSYHQTQDLVLPVMVGTTVLVAVAIAGYARWIGEHALAGAASGLAGPALVAAAYLVAGAGISADRADQQRPWLASLVAVGAGLAASTLVAVVRRKRAVEDDTEPADELTPDTPARTRPVPPPAAPLREDEYVGWVSGLRGSPTEKPRRDSEPDDPTEQLPRPKEPKLHRPYVS